jgi:hypothetical protein
MTDAERRKIFKDKCAKLKKKGVKVKLVTSKVLEDYAGMNHHAAKDMHFPKSKCPKNTILIRRDLMPKAKIQTLDHELYEIDVMSKNGNQYFPAHKKAMDKIG